MTSETLRLRKDKHSRTGAWDAFDGTEHVASILEEPLPMDGQPNSFVIYPAPAGEKPRRFATVEDAHQALIAARQPAAEIAALSYTVIYTGGGEPIVHATGCAHNVRDAGRGAHQAQVITGTLTDVAREVFSDFLCDGDDPDQFLGDLLVKPCAR